MILVMVFLLLTILTQNIGMELQSSSLQFYLTRNQYFLQRNINLAHLASKKIANDFLVSIPACQYSPHGIDWFLKKPDVWWQGNATCHTEINQQMVSYIYIDKGVSACHQFSNQAVHYIEIILHVANQQESVNFYEMIAIPSAAKVHCEAKIHQLNTSIQSAVFLP